MKMFTTAPNGSTIEVPIKLSTFPGGEEYVKVESLEGLENATVNTGILKSSKDVMRLLMLGSVLSDAYIAWDLVIPYMPYGRQDRACEVGEASSLRVFLTMLRSTSSTLDTITTFDAHNPKVTEQICAALDIGFINVEQHTALLPMATEIAPEAILAPDKGALGKASDLAKIMGLPLIVANKERTSQGIEVTVDVCDYKKVLVVDDICDGGGTFIALSRKLRTQECHLLVTHGIFCKNAKQKLYANGWASTSALFDWDDNE